MTLHIRGSMTGPVVLGPNSKRLTTITSAGAVVSTGIGVDGIDGPVTNLWPIANDGTISASGGLGISLAAGGSVSNGPGALISGGIAGILMNGARGMVANAGSIYGAGTGSTVINTTLLISGDGIALLAGGSVTNTPSGSISAAGPIHQGDASGSGILIVGAPGTVANAGSIHASAYGIALDNGGPVTNSGSILGGEDGVKEAGAIGSVVNTGSIVATVDDGIGLFAGGDVTNAAGALIQSGPGFGPQPSAAGVFITGGPGTVENSGTIQGTTFGALLASGKVTNSAGGFISGSTAGVGFSSAGLGTLANAGQISASGAAGADLQGGGTVTNAAGASISGTGFGVFVDGGPGTVVDAGTLSGASDAVDFVAPGAANELVVDPGAVFQGAVGVSNGGTLTLAGSPGVATEVFQLNNASLDVAAAIGTNATINFASPSELAIDHVASFGTGVGTGSYAGPLLEDFTLGDNIGLKDLGFSAGVTFAPLTPTGVLQITSGSRVADLMFQTSSLGAGAFHAAPDNNGGTLISLA